MEGAQDQEDRSQSLLPINKFPFTFAATTYDDRLQAVVGIGAALSRRQLECRDVFEQCLNLLRSPAIAPLVPGDKESLVQKVED
jgi:hypothetical protein